MLALPPFLDAAGPHFGVVLGTKILTILPLGLTGLVFRALLADQFHDQIRGGGPAMLRSSTNVPGPLQGEG